MFCDRRIAALSHTHIHHTRALPLLKYHFIISSGAGTSLATDPKPSSVVAGCTPAGADRDCDNRNAALDLDLFREDRDREDVNVFEMIFPTPPLALDEDADTVHLEVEE